MGGIKLASRAIFVKTGCGGRVGLAEEGHAHQGDQPEHDRSMTRKIGAAAEAVAAPALKSSPSVRATDPVSIEGHYDEAVSVIGLLEEIHAGEAQGVDGYVIACFGDPGLRAAREIAKGPVLGIAEAAMHTQA